MLWHLALNHDLHVASFDSKDTTTIVAGHDDENFAFDLIVVPFSLHSGR